MNKRYLLIVMLVITALFVTQCTSKPAEVTTQEPTKAQAEPTTAQAEPTTAQAEPTKAVAAEPTKAPSTGEISRAETVIFTVDGGRITNPEVWNPYLPGTPGGAGLLQSMLEPLLMLNYATGKIDPWLGESMTSNETLDVWTLKLRKGAYWSDGKPITANDVVFSINLLISKAPDLLNSPAMKDWVKEVKMIDDYTVEFSLNKPNPRFQLDYFAAKIVSGVQIVPEHIFKDQDPLTFTNYDPAKGWPVFSGPYKLEKASDTQMSYVRDDNWWGAKTGFKPLPKPRRLVWLAVPAEESQMSLISQGELDSLNNVSVGAYKALNQKDASIIAWNDPPLYATFDPCSLELTVNHAVEPWNDKDMRWVLNYVLDRDQVVAIAYEGAGQASKHFFPYYKALMKYVKLLEDKGVYGQYPMGTKDLDKATQILESRGYKKGSDGYWEKDGKQLKMEFSVPEYVDNMRIVQVVVEQFQQFGINAISKNVASSSWWGEIAAGKFEAAAYIQGCGSVSEPWAGMNRYNVSFLKPVGENAGGDVIRWQGAKAEEYGKLVDELGTLALDDPKVEELYVKAMTLWMEEAVTIPITQNLKIVVMSTKYWTNWPTVKNDYIGPWAWWQQTVEILTRLEPVVQ